MCSKLVYSIIKYVIWYVKEIYVFFYLSVLWNILNSLVYTSLCKDEIPALEYV